MIEEEDEEDSFWLFDLLSVSESEGKLYCKWRKWMSKPSE